MVYTFADWYKTPWDKINVDVLVEETKKMAKDVKTLNKAVSWQLIWPNSLCRVHVSTSSTLERVVR